MHLNRRQCLLSAAAAVSAQSQPLPEATLRKLLVPPAGKVQAVIDSDTYNEIDDQYAVAYALLSPDRIEVEAIYAAPYLNARSTSPADGMQKSYEEILRLLKFLGQDPSGRVFRGSERFMASAAAPVESDAARQLIARAMQPRQAPLYVLTLGCPVNVASAILLEPKIKERIVVVWLGGACHTWPSAREFNLFQDPHASRVLLDSGVPLVQIPTKNVAEHLRTTLPEAEFWLKDKSRLCNFLYEQFVDYYKAHTRNKPQPYPWSKVIWDISTVAWVIEPRWIPSELVPSPILTDDLRWERKPGRHSIRVATHVDRDPVFYDLFTKLART
ncbi:MAG: nucleoside hydrolase [Acidobacteria bacterium]|nr:nucleoside hydrolase [Acidobacteriota bacterium]